MEEAPENGKESSHSAHANGMNECNKQTILNYLHYQHIPTVLIMCIPQPTQIEVMSGKEQARKSKFL